MRVLQMLSAFLLGVIISQLFGQTFCGIKSVEEIDDQSYLLVVLILTAPKNIEQRETMRDTWLSLRPRTFNGSNYQKDITFVPRVLPSSFLEAEGVEQQKTNLHNYQKWITTTSVPNVKVPGIKIKHLFAIGTFGLENDVMNHIKSEQKVFNDLLLIDDLQDSYRNLTLKLIKSMQKLNRTTPNFKYVLKTDDDSYVKLDLMTQDLIQYESKVKVMKEKKQTLNNLELYWGYFVGRANIKKSGPWQEINYNLCDSYLPYALGGGYVLSKNLVKYIAEYGDNLSRYGSEDVSVGTWLSPFKNIHRRHDLRFDTEYMPRKCKNYHFVLHKRTAKDMREIHAGDSCFSETAYGARKRPREHFYDWTQSPTKCCDNKT
jgi:galactosylxylosylprotein 3-beta-galactosyltransferase